jgi:hypothetical protein
MGLNFKLDIGLYRLDQQVACQRYRQNSIDATSFVRETVAAVKSFFTPTFVPVYA